MRSYESDLARFLRERQKVQCASDAEAGRKDEEALSAQWREAIHLYKSPRDEEEHNVAYPRGKRLFEIVREDGRIKLMLGYAAENPAPDLKDHGQRRQVECILGFEQPLEHLMHEASHRWQVGDFEGEAALLEEFANSNPQKETILRLAAEARRDALSGSSVRERPRRRKAA